MSQSEKRSTRRRRYFTMEFRDLPADPYRKKKIPKALAEQVWLSRMGRRFEGRCRVSWCRNRITVFDYECGHNIPESKGGKTTLDNLVPICARCNRSMGDKYTIDEWTAKFRPQRSWFTACLPTFMK